MIGGEKWMYLNNITHCIIGAAIEVHKELGPGLLETVYETCLVQELENRGMNVCQQVELPLYYKGAKTNKKFKIDLLVEKEIIVELKAVDKIQPIHEEQLVTYLKLSNKNLGLLINFNVKVLKEGIKRKILG